MSKRVILISGVDSQSVYDLYLVTRELPGYRLIMVDTLMQAAKWVEGNGFPRLYISDFQISASLFEKHEEFNQLLPLINRLNRSVPRIIFSSANVILDCKRVQGWSYLANEASPEEMLAVVTNALSMRSNVVHLFQNFSEQL